MFSDLLTVAHVFICVFLILLVLLQQGKGADVGATFGGGGNTMFGASGADNLLSRVTKICAFAFMCTSVMLAMDSNKVTIVEDGEIFQNLPDKAEGTIEFEDTAESK